MKYLLNCHAISGLFSSLGACEGTLSCSTCHLIFKPDEMKKLNLDEPSDEELDMLDLAYGLEETYVRTYSFLNQTGPTTFFYSE